MANMMSICNCPMARSAPAGLKITQKYIESDAVRSKGVWNIRDIALKVTTSRIDRKRQIDGLMPNIIHSFDASNIVKTVEILRDKDVEIFTIHDCFASQAANVHIVQQAVKEGFIKLYINRDVLSRFHESCLTNLENHDPSNIVVRRDEGKVIFLRADSEIIPIPKIPELGSFDANNTIDSKYMVC